MPQRPMFPALFLLCCLISGGDSIVLPAGYSSVTPPSRALGLAEPTLVLAQMYATKVHSVNEKKESISIEGYFRLSWQDSRLNTSTTEVEYPNADSIWKPDFYLSNAIRNNFGSEGTQYDGEMLRISPSGAVLWSQRMRLEMDRAKVDCNDAKEHLATERERAMEAVKAKEEAEGQLSGLQSQLEEVTSAKTTLEDEVTLVQAKLMRARREFQAAEGSRLSQADELNALRQQVSDIKQAKHSTARTAQQASTAQRA